MKTIPTILLCWIFAFAGALRAETPKAYAVKIDGQICPPQLCIVKRAIRAAESGGAKLLLLDMDTPGGDLETTLNIMEALRGFRGTTVCYVNKNAVSAGSFIASACDKIFFAPEGVMGAAEAVNAAGGDIDEGMRRKITSFLSAKVRAMNGGNSRRAQVQRAMNDPNFELKIGGKTIKKKGELLTLTAREAEEKIGGAPLLSDGTAKTLAEAAERALGEKASIEVLRITWAESVAKYISAISPLLMGLGFILIFIDIKSGAFGLAASAGLCLLLAVFVGANLSGIAGYEEIIVFAIGAGLVAVEIFLLPGTFIPALLGGALMLGSLAWALGDIIPERGLDYNADGIYRGINQVGLAIICAAAGVALLWRWLPKTPFMKKMVLESAEKSDNENDGRAIIMGARGVAITDLMPTGKVRVGDDIVEAVALVGHIKENEKIEIAGKKDFNFLAKKLD